MIDYPENNFQNYQALNGEILVKAMKEIDHTIISIEALYTMLDSVKEEIRKQNNNGISSGVQFILMYYFGLLSKPIFKNNTVDSKLLVKILNSGDHSTYRKWLSSADKQISNILKISIESPYYNEIPPFTKANIRKVCEIIQEFGLEKEITQPFELIEKLLSAEKKR